MDHIAIPQLSVPSPAETSLYYLQSRYYNPEVGRFLNADSYTSTGQGLLGNNMFAYCNNNPANGYDPCGTCIHNWKFYDCEKCAEFWNAVGEWCVDAYNTITSVYQQQDQLQMQITMEQNKMIADAVEATLDAYMRGYNILQELQLAEDQMMATISPRIIKAGVKGGVEAAIFAATYNEMEKFSQNGDPKSTAAAVAISFFAGFVSRASMEIWNIFEEALAY